MGIGAPVIAPQSGVHQMRWILFTSLSVVLLVIPTATASPVIEQGESGSRLSLHQKNAALQPIMRKATDCIVRTVAGHPGFSKESPTTNLGDLIVSSMESCTGPVRAMIDAYDRYFGDGSGEAFFMGPYLDVLPTAVQRQLPDTE